MFENIRWERIALYINPPQGYYVEDKQQNSVDRKVLRLPGETSK